jgi:hypothetical protein
MSLLRHHGHVECPRADSDEAVDAILSSVVNGLLQIRALDVERTGREIRFRGGGFRLVLNTRLSVGITRGRISLPQDVTPHRKQVSYELTFTESFVAAVSLGICFGVFFGTVHPHGWVGGVSAGTGATIYFFLLTRATTVCRFRRALRRWVSNANLGRKPESRNPGRSAGN